MAMPSRSKTAVDRRVDELDTIASVPPIDRRDELAELLTDQDIEALHHLVNEGMGGNTLRALTLPICRPGRSPQPAPPFPGRGQRRCC
jgi:hypothetical protein